MSRRVYLALLTALLATAISSVSAQTATEPTRVLIVYGHDPNAPGVIAFGEQLRGVVRTGAPARTEFYEESLDLDRFDDPKRSEQLARYFAEKYERFRPDAIVAAGSLALKFAMDHLGALFPGVPVVYGLAFEPVVNFDALPPNVTGRRQPLPFALTFKLARALHPDAERVLIVAGAAARDSVVGFAAVREITPLLNGMTMHLLQQWTYESLLDSLRNAPPRTIVILSAFTRDQTGYEFSSEDIIPSLARAASVPLYGISRTWIGGGIVGGSVINFGDDGKRTGELLVRVLRRARGELMPPEEVARTPFAVDWRQMERWGLSKDRLPANTEILFRTPTLWERHWPVVLTVLGVLGAESVLLGLLLLERRRRVRAQHALEDQSQYEQMVARLTIDAVRVADEQAPRALEEALARVGRFAGASAAVLNVNGDPHRPPTRLFWSEAGDDPRIGAASGVPQCPADGGDRLEVPLVAESTKYGVLELYRSRSKWPATLVTRMRAAADLIAGALAREREARALEQTRGQIAHMARVATVWELAGAVSHELRQPLTAIRANAEAGTLLLAQDPPDVNEAREIFQEIVDDDRRAAEVIDHIGMLVRKQAPISTTVDLNAVCRQTAQFLERDLKIRSARLALVLDPRLPPVSGDPVQLQQVVINLTLNAFEAAASSPRAHVIVVGTATRGRHAEIFVRDHGPGLTAEMQSQVFEPFFSTKAHGLGMGLAIVRTIVERHRGNVRAENASSGGAIFRVSFPTIQAESSPPSSARGAPAQISPLIPAR